MIAVAEHASEAGTYQPNTMNAASILRCSEYVVRHNAQPDRSAFLDSIVGRRGSLRPVLSQVEAVARTNTTVMIAGETGTGKEVIARAIHELSPRRNQRLSPSSSNLEQFRVAANFRSGRLPPKSSNFSPSSLEEKLSHLSSRPVCLVLPASLQMRACWHHLSKLHGIAAVTCVFSYRLTGGGSAL